MRTLKPSFDKIVKVLSDLQPQYLCYLHDLRDELYLLVNTSLQLHYLKLLSASFSENFYGLERKTEEHNSPANLKAYICLVLIPYFDSKLQRLFNKLREDQMDGLQYNAPVLNYLRSVFVKLYPYLYSTWELANLGMLTMFCLHKTKYHSLLALFAGYHLVYKKKNGLLEGKIETGPVSNKAPVQHLFNSGVSLVAKGITFGLEAGSFFLLVIDHWYNKTNSESKLHNQLVPPPPRIEGLTPGDCPLCGKKRRGSTVLTSSGIIYCYSCIIKYIRKKHKCPVTQIPSHESQLVRIFTSSD